MKYKLVIDDLPERGNCLECTLCVRNDERELICAGTDEQRYVDKIRKSECPLVTDKECESK